MSRQRISLGEDLGMLGSFAQRPRGALGFTGSVTTLSATIPVIAYSGNDYGAEAMRAALDSAGWFVTMHPNFSTKKLEVLNLHRKDRLPFDPDVGAKVIANAASSVGVQISAFAEWVVTTAQTAVATAQDLQIPNLIRTSVDKGISVKQQIENKIQKKGFFEAFGLPAWTPYALVGVGALVVLSQVASIKRSFLGDIFGEP